MYHYIVKQKLRRAFAHINAGHYERILPQFAAKHRHIMYGDHALGGERNTLASTTAWYARLQRLLPDLSFNLQAVTVAGWPWNTTATVVWTDQFTLPDGTQGNNQGVHVFTLAWGRVTSLVVHCDTEKLAGYCARLVAQGLVEAGATAISDNAGYEIARQSY